MPRESKTVLPIEHFNYDDLDEHCECPLCLAYREAQRVDAEIRESSVGHRPDCHCTSCQNRKDAHIGLLAATNKRDIYSELSYLACKSKYQSDFMRWIGIRVLAPDFPRAKISTMWWAYQAANHSLRWWADEWLRANIPQELWRSSGFY